MDLQELKVSLHLTFRLFLRDIQERYNGTMLGWLWLLAQPLFMLLVYTLVFGEVLQLRFNENTSTQQFSLYLFAGLVVFNALSEVATRATTVLTERRDLLLNTPLSPWILPILPVAGSLVLEGLAVLILLFALIWQGDLDPVGPFFYFPFLLIRLTFSLAIAYFLAVLGVFLRDLRQLMPMLLTVFLFISPILYPLEVIPERFLPWYEWNYLGQLVTAYRDALLEGHFDISRFAVLGSIAMLLLAGSLSAFRNLMSQARYVL